MSSRRKSGRFSLQTDEGVISVMDTVRIRTQKLLRSTTNYILKLDGTSNVSTLRVMKDDLEEKWREFVNAFQEHEDALSAMADAELDTVTREYVDSNTKYVQAKIHLASLIEGHITSQIGSNLGNANHNEPNLPSHFKMPPIRITPFSGDSTSWIEFKATCESVLTDRLSEVQRLQYLKDALIGEPREIVRHILPGIGAYAKAMQLLQTNYASTRNIVNDHLRAFYAIPHVISPSVSVFRSMLNTVHSLIAGLNCCGVSTDSWNSIIIFHLSQRFDSDTLKHWEEKLEGKRSIPELKTMIEFLETRIVTLGATEQFANLQLSDKTIKANVKQTTNGKPLFENKRSTDRVKAFYTLKPEYKCVLCGNNHLPSRCDTMTSLSVVERQRLVKRSNLCENCFYPHAVQACPFQPACKRCSLAHNTLLHMDNTRVLLSQVENTETGTPLEHVKPSEGTETDQMGDDDDDNLSEISRQHFFHVRKPSSEQSLLATALVPTRVANRSIMLKTLIDQGATANVISLNACQLLNLRFTRYNSPIFGMANTVVGNVIGEVSFEIGSIRNKNYTLDIHAMVVREIGEVNGFSKDKTREWTHLQGLPLADPAYFEPGKLDLLLGSAAHGDIILGNIIKGQREHPIAQLTELGWIISGRMNMSQKTIAMCHTLSIRQNNYYELDLNRQLRAFWEIEEISTQRMLTVEEQMAEEMFKKSVHRAIDGKFVFDLPFKMDPWENLGDSRLIAERRYKSLQRKFIKNPQLKEKYDAVLEEYLSLGHMKLVSNSPSHQYFVPHHSVEKESSTTTKVRVVFDASAKTTSGVSLNDCLCVGPVIQPDLFQLLLNWRKFEYAISGDIAKMYRMFWINENHADFQTILWQRPGSDIIQEYKLLTVTFGTSSAPFQAIRGLFEIGDRIKDEKPKLTNSIQKCFYVDDYMESFPNIESAIQQRKELTAELADYGLQLRKWKSNDERTLQNIEDVDREELSFDSTLKTLGISWQPNNDSFVFKSSESTQIAQWTKRKVLSEIAKLFDPVGWLAPCIVKAKLLMQDIWRLSSEITWDSALPKHIVDQWVSIFNEIVAPVPIKIPRWIRLSNKPQQIELHTFGDASNIAYSCCVYLRIIHSDGSVTCHLVAAKTKVAPIRATTIPRLELCGALLASKLVVRCIQALSLTEFSVIAWSDSKIVLAWLATHPSKWATFVANRVSEIQQNVDSKQWLHIPSKLNPADIASRGLSIAELEKSALWWHGPSFLNSSSESSPKQNHNLPIDTAPEKRKPVKLFHTVVPKPNDVLNWFSDYTRLLRFTCYTTRWLNRHKQKITAKRLIKAVDIEPITAVEIEEAENRWIKIIQKQHFGHEIGRLSKSQSLPKNSALMKLNPFVDNNSFLRMNGRVGNAELLQQKMSIILPADSHFTQLVIKHVHEHQVLHGGVQLTLRAVRERFWIIHARSQIKKLTGHCLVCYRTKKKLLGQQMADLPPFRTEQARPFTYVGTDYAGYFEIKPSELRRAPLVKGYVVLFICLTTKAVHLELACDLTSAEFIMALENFIARRGKPTELWADNATNYIGAEQEIRSLHEQWLSQNNELTQMLATNRITFKHTPARASHMAGIWERTIGLVKAHLKRVMKDTKLTARRFDHVLKQIECCLNSRPLWAVSPESDDIEVLTPSHFFNFQPINTLPRPDLSRVPINRLDQYQYLHRLYTEFWKGWSREYLDQLQAREKWNKKQPNVKIGQIVVISDDNIPPSRWPIGKISAVYPGKDGLVRVVDVLCRGNTLKRPVHRLGILPIIDNSIELNHSAADCLNEGENVGDF